MKTRQLLQTLAAAAALTACGTPPPDTQERRDATAAAIINEVETTPAAVSTANTLDGYKVALAHRISQVNSTKVFIGRPQALLRSVVVVKYQVDSNGALMRSEIMRSNRIRVNEQTALLTLKETAPFPKPAPALLRNGRVEILETWLFNNDGRFQLRTIAEPQMNE